MCNCNCKLFEYDPVLTWEEIVQNYNLPYCYQHVMGKGRMVSKGQFPAPQQLNGPGSRLVWRRSQIEAWLASRPTYVPPFDTDEDDTAPE